MQASLSYPAPPAHPNNGFATTPDDDRLLGLTHDQLADRLRWLSWYAPGIFTAVMDFMEFTDALAADRDYPAV